MNGDRFVVYSFFGGELDGERFPREMVEAICDGYTPDYSEKRRLGVLCPRAELDNQPTVDGYCGPMYDGMRYIMEDGTLRHDFENVDQSKIRLRQVVLRYETPEFYEAMSI